MKQEINRFTIELFDPWPVYKFDIFPPFSGKVCLLHQWRRGSFCNFWRKGRRQKRMVQRRPNPVLLLDRYNRLHQGRLKYWRVRQNRLPNWTPVIGFTKVSFIIQW